jgi:transcriptional regulator with XRE-family HTH domain
MVSDEQMQERLAQGARLGEAIALSRLTLRQVAGKVGDDPSNIPAYVKGRRSVNPYLLQAFAVALRVPVEGLLGLVPLELAGGQPPGTCPASLGLGWGGRAMIRLICVEDEGPEHPVAHHDLEAADGGVWWIDGTAWGKAREDAWLMRQLLQAPGPPRC